MTKLRAVLGVVLLLSLVRWAGAEGAGGEEKSESNEHRGTEAREEESCVSQAADHFQQRWQRACKIPHQSHSKRAS